MVLISGSSVRWWTVRRFRWVTLLRLGLGAGLRANGSRTKRAWRGALPRAGTASGGARNLPAGGLAGIGGFPNPNCKLSVGDCRLANELD